MEFYSALSGNYDSMTRFSARFTEERETLGKWVKGHSIRTALDAACGTGLHALALAGLGVESEGVDNSPAMLERARENALRLGLTARFTLAPMQRLPARLRNSRDALFCLGNSLPHLLTPADLGKAMTGFHRVLRPGGLLLVQVLNYARILKEKRRIVNVTRDGKLEFVRFYDFLEKRVRFNVLTITEEGGRPVPSLVGMELVPWRKQDLVPALEKAGFIDIRIHGDLKASPFDSMESPNLVIACRKKGPHGN